MRRLRQAIDGKYPFPTLAQTRPVICELECDTVPAREKGVPLPPEAFQVQQVVGEDRLVVDDVKSVSVRLAALGDKHAFGTAGWHLDLCRNAERAPQKGRSVCSGNARDFAAVDEFLSARRGAWPGRGEAREGPVIQRIDLILPGFLVEDHLKFLQLVGMLRRNVLGLRVILAQVVKLPSVARRNVRQRDVQNG